MMIQIVGRGFNVPISTFFDRAGYVGGLCNQVGFMKA